MSAAPRPSLRFPALRHRDFRVLWLGMLFASGTMAFQYYAQIWLIYSLTDSALVLGLLGATRGVAMLIFGLYGGALADRLDRRRLLMATSAFALLVNAMISVMAVLGIIELWQAFLLIFISAAAVAIDHPVRQALIPELVPREHIPNAVALAITAQMGTFALTPALAGFVIDSVGPGGAYALSTVGNVGVIIALALLRYRGQATEARREPVLVNIREGVGYVGGNPTVLRVILVMLTLGALGSAVFSGLIVKWVSEILHMQPGQYGILASLWGTGTLVTAYWLSAMRSMRHRGRIFIVSSIAFGLTFAAFSFARSIPLVGFTFMLNGAAMAGSNITGAAIVQSLVPNDVRGRVMSLYMMNQSVAQLNAITLGAVAQVTGIEILLPATTLLCTVLVASLVLSAPTLRRPELLEEAEAPPEPSPEPRPGPASGS